MPLAHERRGEGEALVLIHGTGSYRRAWDPVIPRLAAEREVIAVDLPGFGESAPLPPGEPYTVERLGRSVRELLDDLGIERPHVAGNSLGGGIALGLAATGHARSATGLSPVGFWSAREARFVRRSLTEAIRAARWINGRAPDLIRNPVARTLLGLQLAGRPWRIHPDEAVAALENLARSRGAEPTLARLDEAFRDGGRISVPVTIAWGTRDRLMLPRQGRRAQRLIPSARLVPLPGCGHVPMSDDPELVARVLLEGSAPSA